MRQLLQTRGRVDYRELQGLDCCGVANGKRLPGYIQLASVGMARLLVVLVLVLVLLAVEQHYQQHEAPEARKARESRRMLCLVGNQQ